MAETSNSAGNDLEKSRAGLIEKIYELLLAPAYYDAFMEEWDRHLTERIDRLQDLRDTSQLINDPVLEAHFNRAFSILERLGRGSPSMKDENAVTSNASVTLRRDGSIHAEPEASEIVRGATQFSELEPLFDIDSWMRLTGIFANLRRAPQAGRMLVLTLEKAEPEQTGTAFLTAVTARDDSSGEIVLRLEPLEMNWSSHFDDLLEQSFRLTPSEIRLVRSLAEGYSLSGLSQTGGRSLNTLRSQLKSVFQKTRTNSQADLARLVGTLSSVGGDLATPISAEPVQVLTGRLDSFALPDGRNMPVHMLGPEDGIPVIFIHGMLDGVAVTSKIHHLLGQFGIRLIAPVRPNFGQADRDTRVKPAPENFARDVFSMINALELKRCLVIGHLAGSVYAFAAAKTAAQTVCGLVSVSGGVPIKSVRQFSLMTQRQRTVAYTARFAPKLLPAVLRAGIAQIDSADPGAFMKALYPHESPDRNVVKDPLIAAAILDGYRFAVAQGHLAFETDSYHVTRDWSQMTGQSNCPVLMLHGVHDPVVNVDTVRDFAGSLGNRAELREFADSGQLLFYQKPEQVLGSVVEFWEQIN
tara:strand:- start:295 stop:2043 length:1749 start_codon:yes stop_codon:yes gene_type:complete